MDWFLICLALAAGSSSANAEYQYKIKTFEVPLDHFAYTNNQTFKIRYLINDSYVHHNNADAPILFYTGNEGDIELFAQNTGFMWETAPKLSALLVFAEHRYYGQSLPFGNQSFDSAAHLGYLTSEQALADYAALLADLNPSDAESRRRPVIALGGSYGGMLAAWFRMKYPHAVNGAVAASAPIFQFTGLTPCSVFTRIVTSVFATAYKPQCSENVRKSWNVLNTMASTSEGRTQLTAKFALCPNSALNKTEDVTKLTDYLTDVYGNLAMVNYPYGSSFLAPLPAYPVREFCARLAATYPDDTQLIDALQSAVSVYSNYTGSVKCLDLSSAYDTSMGDSQWEFQTCTEMVMPMCSGVPGDQDMFPKVDWNFKSFSDECFVKFGVRPNEKAATTNYGGTGLEGASNIIFSNGLLDPWSGGGVLRTANDRVKIVIIPEGAHHLDLRASNAADPVSVIVARQFEVDTIKAWIGEHYVAGNSVHNSF